MIRKAYEQQVVNSRRIVIKLRELHLENKRLQAESKQIKSKSEAGTQTKPNMQLKSVACQCEPRMAQLRLQDMKLPQGKPEVKSIKSGSVPAREPPLSQRSPKRSTKIVQQQSISCQSNSKKTDQLRIVHAWQRSGSIQKKRLTEQSKFSRTQAMLAYNSTTLTSIGAASKAKKKSPIKKHIKTTLFQSYPSPFSKQSKNTLNRATKQPDSDHLMIKPMFSLQDNNYLDKPPKGKTLSSMMTDDYGPDDLQYHYNSQQSEVSRYYTDRPKAQTNISKSPLTQLKKKKKSSIFGSKVGMSPRYSSRVSLTRPVLTSKKTLVSPVKRISLPQASHGKS